MTRRAALIAALVVLFAPSPTKAATPPPPSYDLLHAQLPLVGERGEDVLALAAPGDMSGDGRADLVVVSYHFRGSRAVTRTRVLTAFPPSAPQRLSRAAGFEIAPEPGFDDGTLEAVGDVNGDGLGDLAVASDTTVRVLLATRQATTGQRLPHFDLSGLETLRVQGSTARDSAPFAAAGDVNGDGLGDIVLGSPAASPEGRTAAGSAYVVFGSANPRDTDVSNLGLGEGTRLDGPADQDHAGSSVSAAGDFDGDGHADVAVAGDRRQPESPSDPIWVVRTPGPAPSRTLAAPASGDVEISGAAAGAPMALAPAGDVNGDGLADLGAGDFTSRPVGFLAYGQRNGDPIDVRTRGVTFEGRYAGPVKAAGDVNGDGRSDLAVRSTIVFGGTSLPAHLTGKDVPRAGFDLLAGRTLVPLGDVDGDGRGDLAVRSYRALECADTSGGSVMFVPGVQKPPAPPAFANATRRSDRLVGGRRGDSIFGARGNDTIFGRGGDDCLTGGADDFEEGTESYRAPRPDDDRIFGGRGDDELEGGVRNDLLVGGPGDDALYGGNGRDVLRGGPGDDYLQGWADDLGFQGRDAYLAGPGNDVIDSRDFGRQTVRCGSGRDRVRADRRDRLIGCERVHRP